MIPTTDRLEFEIHFDETQIEAQAAALQRKFDKPITVKPQLDTREAEAQAKALDDAVSNVGKRGGTAAQDKAKALAAELRKAQADADRLEAALFQISRTNGTAAIPQWMVDLRGEITVLNDDLRKGRIDQKAWEEGLRDLLAETEVGTRDLSKFVTAVRDLDREEKQLQASTLKLLEAQEREGLAAEKAAERERLAAEKAAAAAEKLALKQREIEAKMNAAGGSSGGKGPVSFFDQFFGTADAGRSANGAIDNAVLNIGRLEGEGQKARALVAPGGLFAGLAVGAGIAAFELAKLPIEVAKLAEEVGKAGLDLAKFGINAAIEMEPLLNAIHGVTQEGTTLKQLFEGETNAVNAMFAEAFTPLAHQVSGSFFGILNEGLSQFLAGAAPHFAKIADSLAPVLQKLSVETGPVGDKFGALLEKIASTGEKIANSIDFTKVAGLIDTFGNAVDAAEPGIQSLVNGLVDIGDNSKNLIPALVSLGSAIDRLASLNLTGLSQVFDLLATNMEMSANVLNDLDDVLQKLGQTGLYAEVGINGLIDGLQGLIDKAVQVSHIPFFQGMFQIPKFDTSDLSNVTTVMNSTTTASETFAAAIKATGADAATLSSWKEIEAAFTRINQRGAAPLSGNVAKARDALLAYYATAKDGQIPLTDMLTKLVEIEKQFNLQRGESNELTKALLKQEQADQKLVTDQAALAASLDTLNGKFKDGATWATMGKDAQVLFGLALLDNNISLDEMNTIMDRTGLTSKEVTALFDDLAAGIKVFSTELSKIQPTAKDAFDAISAGSKNAKLDLLSTIKEMQALQSDRFAFLNNLDKIIALNESGGTALVRQILNSGLTLQQQEDLANQAIVGDPTRRKQAEADALAFEGRVNEFAGRVKTISQNIGVDINAAAIKGVTDGVPALTTAVGGAITKAATDGSAAAAKNFHIGWFGGGASASTVAVPTAVTANVDAAATAISAGFQDSLTKGFNDAFRQAAEGINLDPLATQLDLVVQAVEGLDNVSASPTVTLNLDRFIAGVNIVEKFIAELSRQVITIPVNIVGLPHKDGGPVIPGITYPVNEAGREGIIDALGFRMLPPPGYQTFDRPGVIIPAKDVPRFDGMAKAAHLVSHSSSVTNNRPEVHIHEAPGRDTGLLANEIVSRWLP